MQAWKNPPASSLCPCPGTQGTPLPFSAYLGISFPEILPSDVTAAPHINTLPREDSWALPQIIKKQGEKQYDINKKQAQGTRGFWITSSRLNNFKNSIIQKAAPHILSHTNTLFIKPHSSNRISASLPSCNSFTHEGCQGCLRHSHKLSGAGSWPPVSRKDSRTQREGPAGPSHFLCTPPELKTRCCFRRHPSVHSSSLMLLRERSPSQFPGVTERNNYIPLNHLFKSLNRTTFLKKKSKGLREW